MARKAPVLVSVGLLLVPTLLASITSPASAALTITAPGWTIIWPGAENQSSADLYSPGDVTGDGTDDIALLYPPMFDMSGSDFVFRTAVEIYGGSGDGLGASPSSRTNTSSFGSFGPVPTPPSPKGWDFNGDGHADLAFGASGGFSIPEDMSTRISIWTGAPGALGTSPTCTKTVRGFLGDGYSTASWKPVGDVNGDGFDDIVAIRPPYSIFPGGGQGTNHSLVVIRGASSCATETVNASYVIQSQHNGTLTPIGAADFNNDGYSDLVTDEVFYSSTGQTSHWLRVFPGAPQNVSQPGASIALRVTDPFQFFVGPLVDGDAFPDLAIGAGSTSILGVEHYELLYYRGSRAGLVTSNPAGYALEGEGVASARASIADVNGDGSVDVVLENSNITGSTDRIVARVYLGQGGVFDARPDWSSTAVVDGLNPDFNFGVTSFLEGSADVDGDGLADIVVLAGADPFGGIIDGGPGTSTTAQSAILVFYGRQIVQFLAGVGPVGFDRGVAYPTYEYGFDVTVRTSTPTALDKIAVVTTAGNFSYIPINDTFVFEPNVTLGTVEFARIRPSSHHSFDSAANRLDLFMRFEFTWDFPIEAEVPFRLVALGPSLPPPGPGAPAGTFRVEKDLEFGGSLVVENASTSAAVAPGSWVRGAAALRATGLTVHFEGAPTFAAPAGAFSWVASDDGGSSWSQGPGAPDLALAFVADAATDPDEHLVVSLSGLPNAEVGVPTRSFPFRVDASELAFGQALPANETWVASHDVTVAIQLHDPHSGVDPSRVEFQVSTTGPLNFGTWHPATVESGSLNNATATAAVNFLDGQDNYFRFRAYDAVGNGPSISPEFQVRVDTLHVIFEDPSPSASIWHNTSSVSAGVTVRDLGASGVRPDSVAYRISNEGLFGFGPWVSVPGLQPGTSVRPQVTVALAEGDQNFIVWRAEDVVGTGLTLSPYYRILDDTTAPVFGPVDPADGVRRTAATLEVTVNVTDGGPPGRARSGLDTASVQYTLRTASGNDTGWTRAGLSVLAGDGVNWTARVTVVLEPGPGNELRLRALDLAGNGPAEATRVSYHLNRAPTVNLTTNATNHTVYTGSNITLIAAVDDTDNDAVLYQWFDGDARLGENNTPTISLNLPKGNWTFRVLAVDSFGAETTGYITVHIVDEPPPPPPPPPTPKPTQAGDGGALLLLILLVIVAGVGGLLVVRRMRGGRPPEAR